jgi:hypothetical protein
MSYRKDCPRCGDTTLADRTTCMMNECPYDEQGDERKPLEPCPNHKPNGLGYIQWHHWAKEQLSKGNQQIQCEKCLLWLFKEEM